MIYLDAAATTLEKPVRVGQAMAEAVRSMSSPGRGRYPASRLAEETAFRCRSEAAELFGGLLDLLPFTVDSESRMFRMISDALADAAASVGTSAASFLGGIVGAVPGSVFSAVVAIFAFVYLTADPAGIAESLLGLLPDRTARKTERIFGEVSGAVFLYLRTYLTIMTVTFFELSVGLTVIGVKYALAAALIIAVTISFLYISLLGVFWSARYSRIKFLVSLLWPANQPAMDSLSWVPV